MGMSIPTLLVNHEDNMNYHICTVHRTVAGAKYPIDVSYSFFYQLLSQVLCLVLGIQLPEPRLSTPSCFQSRAARHPSKWHLTAQCDTFQLEHYILDSALNALYEWSYWMLLNSIIIPTLQIRMLSLWDDAKGCTRPCQGQTQGRTQVFVSISWIRQPYRQEPLQTAWSWQLPAPPPLRPYFQGPLFPSLIQNHMIQIQKYNDHCYQWL